MNSPIRQIIREQIQQIIEVKTKERSVLDMSSPIISKLGLKEDDFKPFVFSKGYPPNKKFALVLVKKDGKAEVFSTNKDMKTTQQNQVFWSKEYSEKDSVKSWEIIPMVIKEL